MRWAVSLVVCRGSFLAPFVCMTGVLGHSFRVRAVNGLTVRHEQSADLEVLTAVRDLLGYLPAKIVTQHIIIVSELITVITLHDQAVFKINIFGYMTFMFFWRK